MVRHAGRLFQEVAEGVVGSPPREKLCEDDRVVERDEAGAWRVTTQLRDSALAVAVQRMVFVVDGATSQLLGLEVWLRDGSKIVSVFHNLKENAPVPDSVFEETTDGFRELK